MSTGDFVRSLLGGWSDVGPSTPLDDLVSQIAEADDLVRKKLLCKEVIRRFAHDVDRVCRIAKVADPEAKSGAIFDEALRGIPSAKGSEPYFSKELIKVMSKHLGPGPVQEVWHSLYLRQFLHVLGADARNAEDLLNYQGHAEWLSQRGAESPEQVAARWTRAMTRLREEIPREFGDEDIRKRTDGVWSAQKLKEE
jgi:hypothetical protein